MVLRAVAVGALALVLSASTLTACQRTAPVVAPTVVYVNGVTGGGLETSTEAPTAGGSWEARDEVEVEWHGKWWPAVILEKRRGHWLVHYEGYTTDWDEVVGGERIRARQVELEPEEPDDSSDDDP